MSKYVEKNLYENEVIVQKIRIDIWPVVGCWVRGILLCWTIWYLFVAIRETVRYCFIAMAVTNRRIVYKDGVFRKYAIDVPLERIINVVVESTFWGRVFNYHDLYIYSETSCLHKRVRRAEEVKQVILAELDNLAKCRMAYQANWTAQAMARVLSGQDAYFPERPIPNMRR